VFEWGEERGMTDENRTLLDKIRDGMEVVDKAGTRIGTVKRVEGGHFKIDRPNQEPLNADQYVPPDLIESVDETVVLSRSWDELRRFWSESDYAKRHNENPAV
jgi:hypothetical protein